MKKQYYHAVSLSGGKDSTAMLLMMIERDLPIDLVLTADTGMEFPEMYAHLAKVDQYLYQKRGLHLTTLRHPKGFEWLMFEEPKQKAESIKNRLDLNMPLKGNGWPGVKVRWCTGQLKTHLVNKQVNALKGQYQALHYVGIAADEQKRCKGEVYPLVKWGITERDALQYCYENGFDFGGLYAIYNRASCWCCPFQRIGELRKLRKHHPELWTRLRELDKRAYAQFGDSPLGKFKADWSVEQLERRFALEDSQLTIFDFLEEHPDDKNSGMVRYRPPPRWMYWKGERILMRGKNIYELANYNVVMLWNQPALFTKEHIHSDMLPEGYYTYEIRHDPINEACPRLLAKRIMQDYYGTVLINRPIQLNACGWERLENGDVQFIENQKMAVNQYIKQYPAEKETLIQLYILNPNVKELFEEPAENNLLENLYMGVVRGKIHSKGRCSFVAKKQFVDEVYPDYLEDYQRVLAWLKTDGPLESLYKMAYFCAYYGEQARLSNDDTLSYGFCIETEYYKYFLRCTPVIGEEHFQLYGYQKHKTKR